MGFALSLCTFCTGFSRLEVPEQAGTGWDTPRFGSEDKPTDFYMYVYVVVSASADITTTVVRYSVFISSPMNTLSLPMV